jgi:hypothetical protein
MKWFCHMQGLDERIFLPVYTKKKKRWTIGMMEGPVLS